MRVRFEIAKENMTRSSPGVRRVAAILNFFAAHPDQSFTLTDLVRALKLSRATCHALLAGLVEAGYLYRASDKAYVLGPALAAIGRVANAHFSPLQAALPEMRALADEFDMVCSAVFREGNEVVVRDRAASRSHLGWSAPPGTRLPLRPPCGGIFLAWSAHAEAEAWLDQLIPRPQAEFRTKMHQGMAFARRHGFQVAFTVQESIAFAPGRRFSGGSMEWLFSESMTDQPVVLAEELLEDDTSYPPASLVAPVFDAQRQVAFVLSMTGFSGMAKGAEIAQIGKRLREACDRITTFIAGRLPQV